MSEQSTNGFHFDTGMIARMIRMPVENVIVGAWPALCEISKMVGWSDREGPTEVRQIDFDVADIDMKKYGLTHEETSAAIDWLESQNIISRLADEAESE